MQEKKKKKAEQAQGQNGEPAGPERKLEQGEAASEAMGVTVWCGARVRFLVPVGAWQQPAPF